MNVRMIRTWAVLLGAFLLHAGTWADDTDLFASPNSAAPASIMVVFDNGADFSKSTTPKTYCSIDSSGNVVVDGTGTSATNLSGTAGGVEQCALYAAISALPANSPSTMNIGFMMFNTTGLMKYSPANNTFSSCPSGGTGGCAVVDLVGFTPTVKTNLLNWIRNWTNNGNGNYNVKASNMTSGGVMQETWAYFKGATGLSGYTYTAPAVGCGKNYVIYVGDAFDTQASPGDQKGPKPALNGTGPTGVDASPAATQQQLTSFTDTVSTVYGTGSSKLMCTGPGGTTSYTFPGDQETQGTWGMNWSEYMWQQSNIKTSTIGLLGAGCQQSYSAWLQRVAQVGGGEFYPTSDFNSLSKAFLSAVGNIISVNSVFASVSLPVSVNTQGSYLNQIFVGMFRPDSSFEPRWYGNLKQYQLAYTSSGGLQTVDADGNAAINSNTGFITSCARSFWTPTTVNQYWTNAPNGGCLTVANSNISDYPDGNIVEKGAQAYNLRQVTPSARVVTTCGSTLSTCTALSSFSPSTAYSPTLFGSGLTSTDVTNLVTWSRGQNTQNELLAGTSVMRPSVHGDVIHSRPVAVNYGPDTAPQVVAYYGANDGMLHAVNGNQTTAETFGGTSYTPGAELWAFMPPEFYGNIQRIYNDTVPVWFKGTTNTSAQPKPYGMDGPVVAFKGTIGGVAKTYIYASMRRGGRALYAFDVTSPASPALLWKKGCSSADLTNTDCGATTGNSNYINIGQTWSGPKVLFASGYNSGTTPLLVMGGGYDTCEDTDTGTGGANNSCTGSPKGSLVYVIDGTDGHIVAQFPTVAPFSGGAPRSVIGEATVVASNGIAKYAYIADLGGVVYRLDFTGSTVSTWSMVPIAKVGCDTLAACSANRKFMFQPSVVSTDGVTFDILLGTGDREKPTVQYGASNGVQNYFFMFKDQPSSSTWLNNQCGAGNNFICLSALTLISGSSTPTATTLAASMGWALQLAPTEQVVTSAITQFGITTFSTNQPAQATASCTPSLGTSLVYNISYKDASPPGSSTSSTTSSTTSNTLRYAQLAGNGLPPSPVAGTVLINGSAVPFCIGCSASSPLQASKASQLSSVARARERLFWYLEKR